MVLVPSVSALPRNIADTVSCMLFSVPFTSTAMECGFLDEMTQDDAVLERDGSGYISNHLVIVLNDGVSFAEKVNFFKNSGGFLLGWACPGNLYVLAFPARYSLKALESKCSEYMQDERVAYACPDYVGMVSEDYVPNDPFEGDEIWDLRRPDGSNWWLEAIDAPCAWDYRDLFSDVMIGIVDSGVNAGHEEYADRIYFPNYLCAFTNRTSDHGCHVTGIIGADMDNGKGIAGICSHADLLEVDWNPDGLQFWSTTLRIIFGFLYCVKGGAKVVNLSLGVTGSLLDGTERSSTADSYGFLTALVSAALIKKGYDFLAVQSAGNGSEKLIPLDASLNGFFASIGNTADTYLGISADEILDRVLVVGSVNKAGYLSHYCNYGRKVEICAPGDNVYSCIGNGGYGFMSGTSMATPMVTGTAGVVWSLVPSLSADEVKRIILSSTDGAGEYNGDDKDRQGSALPMLNVNLAAVNALVGTGKYGKVTCSVVVKNCTVRAAGRTYSSVDGTSFVFAVPGGDCTAELISESGEVISTASVSVTNGSSVNLEFPAIE